MTQSNSQGTLIDSTGSPATAASSAEDLPGIDNSASRRIIQAFQNAQPSRVEDPYDEQEKKYVFAGHLSQMWAHPSCVIYMILTISQVSWVAFSSTADGSQQSWPFINK